MVLHGQQQAPGMHRSLRKLLRPLQTLPRHLHSHNGLSRPRTGMPRVFPLLCVVPCRLARRLCRTHPRLSSLRHGLRSLCGRMRESFARCLPALRGGVSSMRSGVPRSARCYSGIGDSLRTRRVLIAALSGELDEVEPARSSATFRGGADHRHDAGADGLGQPIPGMDDGG
jgi:hypothetical protein